MLSLRYVQCVQPVCDVKCSMSIYYLSAMPCLFELSQRPLSGAQLSSIEANRSNTCNLDFISRIHKQDTTMLDNNIHLQAVSVQFKMSLLLTNVTEKCSALRFPLRSPGDCAQTMMICWMKMNSPQRMYQFEWERSRQAIWRLYNTIGLLGDATKYNKNFIDHSLLHKYVRNIRVGK